MRISSDCLVKVGAALLSGLIGYSQPTQAAETLGTFGLISDFHFDPFDPPDIAAELEAATVEDWSEIFTAMKEQAMSPWGHDTNFALFASSMVAFAKTARDVDFVLMPGDFLSHRFERDAAQAFNVAPTDEKVRDFAVKTTVFVGNSLAEILPNRPIIVALGNTDSDCGDYEITPSGHYLAGTRDMVRRLAGTDLLAPDFDETYVAGGYYGLKHPNLPSTRILVINDILWSAKYQDACGSGGEAAAETMLDWLRNQLAETRAAGGAIWLIHHIPWGIDPYSTAHSHGTTCAAKVVPFLRQPYASAFIELLRQYRDVVQASYSGHVHRDDYRLLIDESEAVLGLQKVPPAISPIYEQNPGFQLVTYDLESGAPTDFSTYYLANLDRASLAVPGNWQFEYTFTDAYGLAEYSAESVAKMVDEVETGGAVAETFRRLYMVGHGTIPEDDLQAYVCAMTRLEQDAFTQCYCGG